MSLIRLKINHSSITGRPGGTISRHMSALRRKDGMLVRDYLVPSMEKIHKNVLRRMNSRPFKNNRMFINPANKYQPTPAPKGVVRDAIKNQLSYEQKKLFGLWGSRTGVFKMGVGNINALDYATREERLAFLKASLGEVTEANRQYNTRDGHSIWRIIEFGLDSGGYEINPVGQIVNAKGKTLSINKPFLVFYSSKAGGTVFAKKVRKHPPFKAKRFFLRSAHQVYQEDLRGFQKAAFRGLHAINKSIHGKTTRPGPV